MSLLKTNIGQTVCIIDMSNVCKYERERLVDMGFILGRKITKYFTAKGIAAYNLMNCIIALRNETACRIIVTLDVDACASFVSEKEQQNNLAISQVFRPRGLTG